MPDVEVPHGVLQGCSGADDAALDRRQQVGHVADHEQLARDGVGQHLRDDARVRAAEEEGQRVLAVRHEVLEELAFVAGVRALEELVRLPEREIGADSARPASRSAPAPPSVPANA